MPAKNLDIELEKSKTINQTFNDKPEQQKTPKKKRTFFVSAKKENFLKGMFKVSLGVASLSVAALALSFIFPPLATVTLLGAVAVGIGGTAGAVTGLVADHIKEKHEFNKIKSLKRSLQEDPSKEPNIIKISSLDKVVRVKSKQGPEVIVDKSEEIKPLSERRAGKNQNLSKSDKSPKLQKSKSLPNLSKAGITKGGSGRTL